MTSIISTMLFLLLILLGILYAIFGLPFQVYSEFLLIVFWVLALVSSGMTALITSKT